MTVERDRPLETRWNVNEEPFAWPVVASLLLILAWAPVPLGSNRAWSMSLLAMLILTLSFAVLVARLSRVETLPKVPAQAHLTFILLALWAAYGFVQLLPLPMALLGLISPQAHGAWFSSGVQEWAPLSLDRGATLLKSLHIVSLAALFALTFAILNSWRRLRLACFFVVGIGALQATLGISLALGKAAGWFVSGPVEGVGGISGTFVNPNHFAGLLEMCLCVSVGLLLSFRDEGLSLTNSRLALRSMIVLLFSKQLPLLAMQILMMIALLWSGSRGAVLSVVVAIAWIFVIVLPVRWNNGWRGRGRMLVGLSSILVLALIIGGPGVLTAKFASQGISGQRSALSLATFAMAADFPLTGAGLGSFNRVFPAYKSESLGLREYQHAHNDYLEIFAEGGLIAVSMFLGAVGVCLLRTFGAARARQGRSRRALCGGCLAACSSLLIHSLLDFNLQIPANATLFVFLLALGLQMALMPPERSD